MIYTINGIDFNVEIERKKNKNMYLRVKSDNTLFITAHPSVPIEQIFSFIEAREDWILKTVKKVKERELQNRRGIQGPILYLFGEKKYVRYELAARSYVLLDDDIITFYLKEITDTEIEKTFVKFAKPMLMKILEIQRTRWDRVIEMYHINKLPTIKIKSLTSKWGSCLVEKAEITMNLKLIHYPLQCIDYVLWHEYVHLVVPNHSKRFYDLVEYHMPEYKNAKKLLV
ncbi:MAG: M48 family metallopeptidase [Anaerorhabdus sp.]|uniref:M48 family metallopeptidase n=1 Tax=Anaerorhabdus sp. TaxID=1872524 RepID=UPI003A89AB16